MIQDFFLQSPSILLPLFDNFIIVNGNGLLEGMLEPHMNDFAYANQGQVGLAFLLLGGSYLLTSLMAGFVSEIFVHLCNAVLGY